MKMNKLKNNIIIGIFAAILLSSTLTTGTQDIVNKFDLIEQKTDRMNSSEMHPVINTIVNLAEATTEVTQGNVEDEAHPRLSEKDSEIEYYNNKGFYTDKTETDKTETDKTETDKTDTDKTDTDKTDTDKTETDK
ncbi:MAG: hypothetical protein ACE5SW_13325, partial [Nitrososphaeraceae archaeon]